jgi:4-hydroxy-tetrahydrodipicolinate reductase
MNIALLGYGKMGKVIERIALERGHTIAARIDINNQHEFDTLQADVAIEFSHPDAAFENVKKTLLKGIPVVCGTTGWLSKKEEIEHICKETNGAFFYASNYSVGVNLFFKLNEFLAKMVNQFPEYDVVMEEIHHTEKKDAPSGTAITLAEGVLKHFDGKDQWVNQSSDNKKDLVIESLRINEVPGTHTIKYTSVVDDIEIKHVAHSREGFAKGAVLVAEWLKDKKGVLTMDDYLKF